MVRVLAHGGVDDYGTYEEGDLVSREILSFLGRKIRCSGEPVIRLRRACVCSRRHDPGKNKRLHRGRSTARGTGAANDELRKSED